MPPSSSPGLFCIQATEAGCGVFKKGSFQCFFVDSLCSLSEWTCACVRSELSSNIWSSSEKDRPVCTRTLLSGRCVMFGIPFVSVHGQARYRPQQRYKCCSYKCKRLKSSLKKHFLSIRILYNVLSMWQSRIWYYQIRQALLVCAR